MFKNEGIIGNTCMDEKCENLPVTGNPPNPHLAFNSFASATVVVGEITTGSEMKPFSNLLTFLTISA